MPFLSIAAALWGNPWTRLAAVAVACLGIGFVKGFASVPRVDIAAVVRNAEAARDAAWQAKLSEQERAAQAALGAALEVGRTEPLADLDVISMCAADPACRDKGR